MPPVHACDAHVHVYGDPARYPLAEHRRYTPAFAPREQLEEVHETLGFERCVVVHPGVFKEHDVTLDVLRANPGRYRGVAVLRPTVRDEVLDEMHAAGVRGVRIHLTGSQGPTMHSSRSGFDDVLRLAPRLGKRGWHVQVSIETIYLAEWLPRLLGLELDLVVDHMGRPRVDDGTGAPEFTALCDLLRSGRAWCKLSGADRFSKTGAPYDDAVPFARALIAANPERVVWGSDWPHANHDSATMPDDGVLVDLIPKYAPDPATQQKLLVDNPAKLYGFD